MVEPVEEAEAQELLHVLLAQVGNGGAFKPRAHKLCLVDMLTERNSGETERETERSEGGGRGVRGTRGRREKR